MTYTTIVYENADGAGIITLNRPERLNAWTPAMGLELADAVARAAADRTVRAIILTGAGRGFCAGMDYENLAAREENRARRRHVELPASIPRASDRSDYNGLFTYFPAVAKPVIAAVNGPAAGSGMVLTLACDIRFASEDAIFTTSFARHGLVAEHGIAWLLPQLVGTPAALDLLLSARKITASEARSMGLVNFLTPPGQTLDRAVAYAAQMAECSPRSLQIMKRQVWNAAFQTLREATEMANEEMLRSFDSADFRESVAARGQSRQPKFDGVGT